MRTCHYIGLGSSGPNPPSRAVKRSCGRYFSYTQSNNARRDHAEPQNDCSPRGAATDLAPTVRLLHGRPLRLHNASRRPSKEPSAMHAIRKLRESGHATVADYETILAADVVFHSPVLIRAIEGRAVVAKIFATSTTLREGAYTGEWKLDDRRTLLRWKGKIEGHELESFDIIEENDEGLIVDRTIAFRPMPAARLFRDAMRAAMGSSIPDDFWEY
jgi:hypothetical protein